MDLIETIIHKIKGISSRRREEFIYSAVMDEIAKGQKSSGLWGKALAESDGNINKAESTYLKLRAQSLQDEINIYLREEKDKESIAQKPEGMSSQNNVTSIKKDYSREEKIRMQRKAQKLKSTDNKRRQAEKDRQVIVEEERKRERMQLQREQEMEKEKNFNERMKKEQARLKEKYRPQPIDKK